MLEDVSVYRKRIIKFNFHNLSSIRRSRRELKVIERNRYYREFLCDERQIDLKATINNLHKNLLRRNKLYPAVLNLLRHEMKCW